MSDRTLSFRLILKGDRVNLQTWTLRSKPAIEAMHGPHSLVRFDDQVRFGPTR